MCHETEENRELLLAQTLALIVIAYLPQAAGRLLPGSGKKSPRGLLGSQREA